MTIQQGDIKIVASQVMDDVPEGGGAPTGTVIPDGASNGVFTDISELDRAGGRVNLRLLYGHVRTATVDGYFGANVIVAEPYADPRVTVSLFKANGPFERRSSAASRIEAYLSRGAAWPGFLFGDHIEGQRSVSLLQRVEAPLPTVGATLVLVKNGGLPTEVSQYIRVTDVTSMTRTFSDDQGEFQRTVVTAGISDALGADFPGFDAPRYDSVVNFTGKTKTFDTIVADASRYYSAVELAEAASLGDFSVKATGIYTQLVPSTRIEVPIADARMNQQSAALVEAGSAYTRTLTLAFTTTQRLFLGGSAAPGSVSIARGGVTLTDKGGLLVDSTSAQVGTIDYANGIATLSTNVWGTGSGDHLVTYKPAYAPTLVSESVPQRVTPEGQRLSWVLTLDPPPTRGSLSVSFRSLGKWYELRDDGSGALRGADSSYGAGTINQTTGTVSVTLGALPDVDSAVIYTYVPSVVTRRLADLPVIAASLPRAFGVVVRLGRAIKPGTLTFTWNDGTARTSSDVDGVLNGNATGAVIYGEGRVNFRPNNLPAPGTTVNVSIVETVQRKESVSNFTDSGANWTCTLPAPLKAKTVEVSVRGAAGYSGPPGVPAPKPASYRLFDDGAGVLLYNRGSSNVAIGTVNYSTGAVSIPKNWASILVDLPAYDTRSLDGTSATFKQIGYTTESLAFTVANGGGATVYETPTWGWWSGMQTNALEARYSGADASAYNTSFTVNELFMPANSAVFSDTAGYSAKLSSFFIGASLYSFNPASSLWIRDPSATTGAGTNAGANAVVDGMAGVLLSSWPTGASSTPTGVAGATQPAVTGIGSLLSVERAVFRTAVSPLLNGGFNLAGTWATTGATFSVSADSSGVISSGSAPVGSTPGSFGVFAVVDYEMGLCSVAFGRRVPVSMEGDPGVIDISDIGVPGVTKIQAIQVQSDTLRYSATGYSYLPLDPDILGLSPVRLPPDGRVPIFREGEFVVVSNKATTSPATVSNGQTINCGRVRLSRVRVIGNDGNTIAAGFTADLDAGTVTFSNVTGYSQPVRVEHRIEDMALVSDVQLNGRLSFTRPLTHDYPTTGTYVSSALIIGDTKARVSLLFDQVSWNNTWQDSVNGSPATGTFNDAAFPLVVTNSGALTERWACVFQSNNTSFQVIGEHVGVVGTGSVNADYSPTNPATGLPYFTIPSSGWGGGWSAGNVMRFNTIGAIPPFWCVRTILQGPETVVDDKFTVLLRGDIDRP